MRIDALDNIFLKPQAESEPLKKTAPDFSTWLQEQIVDTNNKLNQADQDLNTLALGKSTNLHQNMLHLEQAKISFQYLEQIRNRLMNAYQELLREQI